MRAATALPSVVAVAPMNLRVAARDTQQAGRPAEGAGLWGRVPSLWRHQQARPMTVRELTSALARPGGHPNREPGGLPGRITLRRGWERLHIVLDFELPRAACPEF